MSQVTESYINLVDHEALDRRQHSEIIDDAQPWACPVCTFSNVARFLCCHMCGTQRPSHDNPPHLASHHAGNHHRSLETHPTSSSLPGAPWSCAVCTLLNSALLGVCEACGCDRGDSVEFTTQQLLPKQSAQPTLAVGDDDLKNIDVPGPSHATITQQQPTLDVSSDEEEEKKEKGHAAADLLRPRGEVDINHHHQLAACDPQAMYNLDCSCRMLLRDATKATLMAAETMPTTFATARMHFSCPNKVAPPERQFQNFSKSMATKEDASMSMPSCDAPMTRRDLGALVGENQASRIDRKLYEYAAAAAVSGGGGGSEGTHHNEHDTGLHAGGSTANEEMLCSIRIAGAIARLHALLMGTSAFSPPTSPAADDAHADALEEQKTTIDPISSAVWDTLMLEQPPHASTSQGRGRGVQGSGGRGGGGRGRGRGRHSPLYPPPYSHPEYCQRNKAVHTGTGYAGDSRLDAAAMKEASAAAAARQKHIDEKISRVLTEIRNQLQACVGLSKQTSLLAAAGFAWLPLDAIAVLQGGPLACCLRLLLANDSLMDITARADVYNQVLNLLMEVAACHDLVPLLLMPADGDVMAEFDLSRSSDAPNIKQTSEGTAQDEKNKGNAKKNGRKKAHGGQGQNGDDVAAATKKKEAIRKGKRPAEEHSATRASKRALHGIVGAQDDAGNGSGSGNGNRKASKSENPSTQMQAHSAAPACVPWSAPALERSCWKALQNLRLQSELFMRSAQELAEQGNEEDVATVGTVMLLGDAVNAVNEAVNAWKSMMRKDDKGTAGKEQAPKEANSSPESHGSPEEKSKYEREMKELSLALVALVNSGGYYFREKLNQAPQGDGNARLRRLNREISTLPSSLPVDWNSSVIVVADEQRLDALRACIFPPLGTPYANGCFVFDILLPPNYPDSPPKFQLLTTGGGRVRFNPNLYADGKVCLSILGTWSGPAWIPGESSLCQVLISIQGFILGESQPYGNEPGYERMLNTADGKKASEAYNRQQRYNTLAHSMLPALKKPPFGFEQAVKLHCTVKKEEIKAQIEEWREMEAKLAKSQSKKKGHHHHRWHERETANVGSFDDVAKAVLAELDKLGG